MMKVILNLFSKFLFNFAFIRVLRSFFYSKIVPYLKYLYYLIVLILVAFVPYLVSQHKDYLVIVKNKAINEYITLLGGESFYNKVSISGNNHTNYDDVSKIVRDEINKLPSNEDERLESVIKSIKNGIEAMPWVENVTISRSLPSDLVIKIEEYEPFAVWQDQGHKYVINKNGKIVMEVKDDDFSNLLILSGNKSNVNAESLFNILVMDLNLSKDIYSATLVGSRRWNIRFNNNLLVKLPENNLERAWKDLIKIYNTPGALIDLKSIDLRIYNKIYLEYTKDSANDLKSI